MAGPSGAPPSRSSSWRAPKGMPRAKREARAASRGAARGRRPAARGRRSKRSSTPARCGRAPKKEGQAHGCCPTPRLRSGRASTAGCSGLATSAARGRVLLHHPSIQWRHPSNVQVVRCASAVLATAYDLAAHEKSKVHGAALERQGLAARALCQAWGGRRRGEGGRARADEADGCMQKTLGRFFGLAGNPNKLFLVIGQTKFQPIVRSGRRSHSRPTSPHPHPTPTPPHPKVGALCCTCGIGRGRV
jgi:hypothetical protein